MLKELLKLRPKADDAASLWASLASAETAKNGALARVTELKAGRAARLLDGAPADVERAETALMAAQAEAERLAEMVGALRDRAAAAERRERVAAVRAKYAAVEEACARFLTFAAKDYPALARKIADGLRLESDAHRLTEEAQIASYALTAEERAELPPLNMPRLPHPTGFQGAIAAHGLGAFVRLPAADGDEEAGYWPEARR